MLSSNQQISVDTAPDEQIFSMPTYYIKSCFDLGTLKFTSAGTNYIKTSMTKDDISYKTQLNPEISVHT